MFLKERETNKQKILEEKTTMCEMINILDRIKGKLDFAEKKG